MSKPMGVNAFAIVEDQIFTPFLENGEIFVSSCALSDLLDCSQAVTFSPIQIDSTYYTLQNDSGPMFSVNAFTGTMTQDTVFVVPIDD